MDMDLLLLLLYTPCFLYSLAQTARRRETGIFKDVKFKRGGLLKKNYKKYMDTVLLYYYIIVCLLITVQFFIGYIFIV